MIYNLGDEIRFMPRLLSKQYCFGHIVLICTVKRTKNIIYGVEQIAIPYTPTLICDSFGQNILTADQFDIDSFNNDPWNDYKYVNDILGKMVYIWVLDSDIDHLYVPLQITIINLPSVTSRKLNSTYNSSTGKFELLDDEEDREGLRYL